MVCSGVRPGTRVLAYQTAPSRRVRVSRCPVTRWALRSGCIRTNLLLPGPGRWRAAGPFAEYLDPSGQAIHWRSRQAALRLGFVGSQVSSSPSAQ